MAYFLVINDIDGGDKVTDKIESAEALDVRYNHVISTSQAVFDSVDQSYAERFLYDWVGGLVVYVLTEIQEAKYGELDQAYKDAVYTTFVSSALGTAHTYDATLERQLGILAATTASVSDSGARTLLAHDGSTWVNTSHSTSQLEQVSVDLRAHIQTNETNLYTKRLAVEAALDAETIQAITW